jgi:hypothetical protein
LILLAAIGFAGGVFLYHAAPGGLVCTLDEWNLTAIGRFAMCIAAVILFGWITSSDRAYGCFRRRTPLRWTRVGFAVFAQFLILLLVALIQWFGLSTAKTVAASDRLTVTSFWSGYPASPRSLPSRLGGPDHVFEAPRPKRGIISDDCCGPRNCSFNREIRC